MSSSEEEDYMSAAILGTCDDVRPGLVHGTKKRRLEVEKKKTSLNEMNKDKYKPKVNFVFRRTRFAIKRSVKVKNDVN